MDLVGPNDYILTPAVSRGARVDEDCKEKSDAKTEEDTSLLLIVENSEEKKDGTIEKDASLIRDDENSKDKPDISTEEPFCLFVEEESSSEEIDVTSVDYSAPKQDDVEESSENKELSLTTLENVQGFTLSLPTASNASCSNLTFTELDEDSSNSIMMVNNSPSIENSPLPVDSSVKHSDNEYVVSDSDSDVICIEKKTEIIELSDDENPECVELLSDLNVPEPLIESLKMASNKISLKLGEQIKNGGPVDNILVEVPTVIWELPWKIVTGLFKNPSLNKPAKQPAKQPAKMKKPLNHPLKPKKKKAKESSNKVVKVPKVELPAAQIKKEDGNRIVTFFPDPNKPPEFMEVSRSGRLIKKPKRLKDDFPIYEKSKRRRNEENSEVSSPTDIDPGLETQSDLFHSSENSIDSESCDRLMLGLNSTSDGEDDILSTSSASSETVKTPKYPSTEEVKKLLKKERLLHHDLALLNHHTANERERRKHLKTLFDSLTDAIIVANPELTFDRFKMPKIYILEKALKTIENLEEIIGMCKKKVEVLKSERSKISKTYKVKSKRSKNSS